MSDDFSPPEGSRQPSPPTQPAWWGYIEDEGLIPPVLNESLTASDPPAEPEESAQSRLNLYVGLAVAGVLVGFVIVLLLFRG